MATGRRLSRVRTAPVPVVAAGLFAALLAGGCSRVVAGSADPVTVTSADRQLVQRYFDTLDAAADQGAGVEQEVFRRTQHPDFRTDVCPLSGMTVHIDPTMSTLALDPQWTPAFSGIHPRGLVLRVAVTLTPRRGQADLGEQIGLQHVVLLGGVAYGFAPCPVG